MPHLWDWLVHGCLESCQPVRMLAAAGIALPPQQAGRRGSILPQGRCQLLGGGRPLRQQLLPLSVRGRCLQKQAG